MTASSAAKTSASKKTASETKSASDGDNPGITRKRAGKGWKYFNVRGREISAGAEIARLNAIGLPPAYQNAWYSPDPASPIQATGYDQRGRRQYRYHTEYRAGQEADKFDRCIEFGRRLPKLRAQVETDLAGDPYAKTTVVAAVIRVLDECRIRIGNRAYARANKSFGDHAAAPAYEAGQNRGCIRVHRQIGQGAERYRQRRPRDRGADQAGRIARASGVSVSQRR